MTPTPQDRKVFDRLDEAARGYQARAEQFITQGQRPSLVFNVGSVALEHTLVALCAFHGRMPLNHTYTDLLETVEEVMDLPAALAEEIRALDGAFGLCSLDEACTTTPGPEDAVRVLRLCRDVRALIPVS
ncbi:hypothetical protein [Pararhodospirillum photometricum]|nr:hypothetical protein [Pararhodospirillum photometricum]